MEKLARFALIVTLSVAYISPARASAPPSLPSDMWLNGAAGYARAVELQRELKIPLVVYFYTDWCPYCRTLDRQYLASAAVQDYLRQVVKVRINPEHGPAERELKARYGVTGYPAFFVMRDATAQRVKIHAFRQAGNLSPTQFALACRKAAPVSSMTPDVSVAGKGDAGRFVEGRVDLTTRTVSRPTTASRATQIVTVRPSAPASPTFIPEERSPSLDEVLAKYVEAVGGRAPQMRLTTRVTKGRVDVPGVSHGGRLEVYAKAPNKTLTVMNSDTTGVVRQGFDGRVGWDQSDQLGVRGSTGTGLAALARDAEFYGVLKLKELYARVKLLGRVKHGFRQAYMVEATPRVGEAEMLYFDTESGLLFRRDVTRPTRRGPVRAEIYLSDWREVDGVKLPFKLTEAMPGLTFVFTLEEVRHNVPVDEAIFRRPSN